MRSENIGLPKVLILSGQGINCERESEKAFTDAGGVVERMHVNDLAKAPEKLKEYQILMFPGGFSFGDHTGSGNALAKIMSGKLQEEILKFISKGNLVLGICNGFQVLTQLLRDKLGLFGKVGLAHNAKPGYIDRWVDLEVPGAAREKSPWFKDIDQFSCPIAHGEGQVVVNDTSKVQELENNGQVAFRYRRGEICDAMGLEANPNGSVNNIAGVMDASGKAFGMMPHPERHTRPDHHPLFHLHKQVAQRQGSELPAKAPGQTIYDNGVKFYTGKV